MIQSVMTRHAVSNPESSTTIVGFSCRFSSSSVLDFPAFDKEEGVQEEGGSWRKGTSSSAITSVTMA